MSLTDAPEPRRSTSAERMALLRDRRRAHLHLIAFEVRQSEVAALVRQGLLLEADRNNAREIARALGRWLNGRLE